MPEKQPKEGRVKVAVLAAAEETFSVLKEALEELGHEVVWVADGETRETTKAEVKINEFDLAIIAIAKYETDSPCPICRVLSCGTPHHPSRLWRQQILEDGHKYGGTIDTQRLPALRNHDTSIFKEPGVSTRTEASFVAREAGLI